MLIVLQYGLVVLVAEIVLSFTLYNPAFVTPIYHYLIEDGFIIPVMPTNHPYDLYPVAKIRTITNGLWFDPRASVIGTVIATQQVNDGDVHVLIVGTHGAQLTLEIVPELPLPLPKVGDHIRAWGSVRYDTVHRWWELHPLYGWKVVSL